MSYLLNLFHRGAKSIAEFDLSLFLQVNIELKMYLYRGIDNVAKPQVN